jgi:hypothetical protein
MGLPDFIYSIPASSSQVIRVKQNEIYVKNQDGSLLIDFQTGFTGTLSVIGEPGHLYQIPV